MVPIFFLHHVNSCNHLIMTYCAIWTSEFFRHFWEWFAIFWREFWLWFDWSLRCTHCATHFVDVCEAMPPKTESRAAYSVWKLSFVTGLVVKSVVSFGVFAIVVLWIVFVAFATRKVNTWTERLSMKAQINMNRLKPFVKKLNIVLVHEQFHKISTRFSGRQATKNHRWNFEVWWCQALAAQFGFPFRPMFGFF